MFLNSLIKQNIPFLYLVFILLIPGTTIKAQHTIPEKIIANGKLKWSDYTGEIDKRSNYWATTFWYVHYKYKIIQFYGDTVRIDLQVWPALLGKSWVLPGKKTAELLQHEQGHFDLARLLTLKFKKEAGSTVLLMNNYDRKLDSIFNAALTNIQQMEIQYDAETNHMWNRAAQKRWNKKIADMLKAAE